jgi:excisionase family DNA binding protein
MRNDSIPHNQPSRRAKRLGDERTLAEMLLVSRATVRRRLADGTLPASLRIGGLRRWDLDVVEAWIAGGCLPQRAIAKKAVPRA